MTEQLLQPPSLPTKPGTYADLEAALLEAFDVSFQIWQRDARPDRLTMESGSEEPKTVAVGPDLFAHAAEPPGEPQLILATGGYFWLILPIRAGNQVELIATGLVPTTDQQLLLRLARQFQAQHDLRDQLQHMERERESLICQITADFEELAFLRQMAEHLAMSDTSIETLQMARTMLPQLQERIHAEAVVLVSAGRDKTACLVGRPILSSGRNVIDDKSCTRLVERFRDAAMAQPVVRNHCTRSTEFEPIDGLRSFVLAPMARSKAVLGWLLAINRVYTATDGPKKPGWRLSRHEFGTNEASLLRSTASVLATHATNVELLRDKDQLLFDMVRALVNAIEAKDCYTCGHSERVALYAKHLSSAMGLKARICKRIYLSGLLHDVGKIAVRDYVLTKNGRLDEGEFAEIQQHPDKGWGILFGLEALDDVLAGVLHHHERWDGKGYPDGLAGETIPHDARILAVADAFDAMTSNRPYRQALSIERAESVLREGAGRQWDPTAIGIFLSIMPEITRIRDSYQPREPAMRQGYRMLQELDPDQFGSVNGAAAAANATQ